MSLPSANPVNTKKKRLYGSISLGIMALGSTVMATLLAAHRLTHPGWHVLAGAFQAGLIGGLADWYAVYVLLHPAPWFMRFWPFARHSNLLIRNRGKLEENIVALVERELLSADKIWSHVEKLDLGASLEQVPGSDSWIGRLLATVRQQRLAAPLVEMLDDPGTVQAVERVVAALFSQADVGAALARWLQGAVASGRHRAVLLPLTEAAARGLRDPGHRDSMRAWAIEAVLREMPRLEQHLLREENLSAIVAWLQAQLARPAVVAQIALALGILLDDMVRRGAHDDLIERLLRDLCQWVATAPSVRPAIRRVVESSITDYRVGKPTFRRIVVDVVQQMAINRDKAVDSILDEIVGFLNRLEQEPSHPLRVQFNEKLLAYAQSLKSGNEAALARFDALGKHLLAMQLRSGLVAAIDWATQTLAEQADRPEMQPLIDLLADNLADWLDRVRDEPEHGLATACNALASEFAARLASGQINVGKRFAAYGPSFAPSEYIRQVLSWLKVRLQTALADPQSALWTCLEDSATQMWNRSAHSRAERERLGTWAAAVGKKLIESQHHRLGEMVAASLSAYSDEQLIGALDDKFGDDLQFVRLNGAVLGFLIGSALGVLSLFLSG